MVEADRFLDEVERGLRLRGEDGREILDELRDHLDDSVRALERQGLDRRAATRVAFKRLGPSTDLARALSVAHGHSRWARIRAVVRPDPGRLPPIAAAALLILGAVLAAVAVASGASGVGAGRVDFDLATGGGNVGPLGDPNLVFILVAAGVAGLLFELVHPNIATGIVGGIALAFGLAAASSLPLNAGGVLLLTLSVGLLFLEAHLPSHGLLTGLGLAGLVVGGAIFYGAPQPGGPAVQVGWQVIAVAAALALSFASVVVTAAVRLRRTAPALVAPGLGWTGVGMLGQVGEVHSDLVPDGSIHVAGEEWSARLAGGARLSRGLQVRVIGQDRLTLVVRAIE